MIISMEKLLLVGPIDKKEDILGKLQELGVVHIENLPTRSNKTLVAQEDQLENIRKAVEILSSQNSEVHGEEEPTANTVDEILEHEANLRRYKEHQNQVEKEIEEVSSWGNFSLTKVKALKDKGIVFRFWKVLAKEASLFQATLVLPQESRDLLSVITVSYQDDELVTPPSAKEFFLTSGVHELRQQEENCKQEQAQITEILASYKKYLPALLKQNKDACDTLERTRAGESAVQSDDVFGIQGWIPANSKEQLKTELKEHHVAFHTRKAQDDEEPPTCIKNPPWIQSVLDIVKLYAVPGYKEWDTSASVYFAFTAFFGMIVGDAGYGIILLTIIMSLRAKLMASDAGKRVYHLMTTLSISCIVFGALTGTWFAIVLAENNPLKQLKIIPAEDYNFMMKFSIYVGLIHISLARCVQIMRLLNSTLLLAEVGWILFLWGGGLFLLNGMKEGLYVIYAGLGLILCFSSVSRNPFSRLASGFLNLLGVSQNFADILSYLRLFALGLATTVMGQIFNDLGMQVRDTMPGFGYVFMVLIIFLGHTINLGLAVMGGFIHGLRLNFLEFYRYCFEGTGYEYQPLAKSQ